MTDAEAWSTEEYIKQSTLLSFAMGGISEKEAVNAIKKANISTPKNIDTGHKNIMLNGEIYNEKRELK